MTLHPSLANVEMPEPIAMLPRTPEGWPVPWFVAWVDGVADFRVIRPDAVALACDLRLCWLCGYPLGMQATYVAGPMCGVNRNSAEPPSHRRCALFAAKGCPFLSRPHARRREIPDEIQAAHDLRTPGTRIDRNPGVAMLWTTPSVTFPYTRPGDRDRMFRLPDPVKVEWICEGRDATFDEVKASVESGLPLLREVAAEQGPGAMQALYDQLRDLYQFLPPESAVARA